MSGARYDLIERSLTSVFHELVSWAAMKYMGDAVSYVEMEEEERKDLVAELARAAAARKGQGGETPLLLSESMLED